MVVGDDAKVVFGLLVGGRGGGRTGKTGLGEDGKKKQALLFRGRESVLERGKEREGKKCRSNKQQVKLSKVIVHGKKRENKILVLLQRMETLEDR